MNILQVHHGWDQDEPGGIVAMMNDLMTGLESAGHKVTMLANDWDSARPAQKTDRLGRKYYRFNLVPVPPELADVRALLGWLRRFPLAVWRLRRFCRKQRIDVIQLHYADALFLAFALLRRLGGPPFVVTVHRGDVMGYGNTPPLKRAGYQRVMADASGVVAVSRALGEKAREISPLIMRLEVIYNGYTPPPGALLNRGQLQRELGMELPGKFATLVGNCRPYKGQDIALKAWAELKKTDDVYLPLVIVGGGPDLPAMQSLCASMGLDQCAIFTGPTSRQVAVSLTALSAVQVAPSRNEGQGIVILEAGHVGTPVICSDIPPFLEMVHPGETAVVFPAGDSIALAEKMRQFLANPAAAAVAARKFQTHVRESFTSDAMVERYIKLFRSLTVAGPEAIQ